MYCVCCAGGISDYIVIENSTPHILKFQVPTSAGRMLGWNIHQHHHHVIHYKYVIQEIGRDITWDRNILAASL